MMNFGEMKNFVILSDQVQMREVEEWKKRKWMENNLGSVSLSMLPKSYMRKYEQITDSWDGKSLANKLIFF